MTQARGIASVYLRLWTNEISPVPDTVIPKHAWSSGMVTVVKNESHGIPSSEWRPFHFLAIVGTERPVDAARADPAERGQPGPVRAVETSFPSTPPPPTPDYPSNAETCR